MDEDFNQKIIDLAREQSLTWLIERSKYSPKEISLLLHFGFTQLATKMFPPAIYRLMVEKAFLTDDRTHFAESLRRCMLAMNTGKPHRMTPEWDAMIQ